MKRKVRRGIDVGLPLLGMAVIFGSVLFGSPSQLQIQVILLLVGVLILEAGVWGVTNALLPNERRYPALRQEADHFLDLVRQLNSAAIAKEEDRREGYKRFRNCLDQMRSSVDRMAKVAGQSDREDEIEEPTGKASAQTGSNKEPADGTPGRRHAQDLPAEPEDGPGDPDDAPGDQADRGLNAANA